MLFGYIHRAIPGVGVSLQKPFSEYLEAQRAKLHHPAGDGTPAVRTTRVSLLLVQEDFFFLNAGFLLFGIDGKPALVFGTHSDFYFQICDMGWKKKLEFKLKILDLSYISRLPCIKSQGSG